MAENGACTRRRGTIRRSFPDETHMSDKSNGQPLIAPVPSLEYRGVANPPRRQCRTGGSGYFWESPWWLIAWVVVPRFLHARAQTAAAGPNAPRITPVVVAKACSVISIFSSTAWEPSPRWPPIPCILASMVRS